jgi:hypothetical protein
MKPGKLLHGIGIVLYGDGIWVAPLADYLGVSTKTVRRWTQGKLDIPRGVWADLLKIDDSRLEPVRWRIKRLAGEHDQSGSSRRPSAIRNAY